MRKAGEVDSTRADGSAGVQSVDRALSILEVLARVGEAGRHRDRRRARRPQEHGVPPGRDARGAPPRRAVERPRQVPPRRRECSGWPARPPRASTWSRRPGRSAASSRPTPARPSTSRCSPRAPRSTSTRSPAPRRSSRTTGSASTSRCTPPATARCCSADWTSSDWTRCWASCRRTPPRRSPGSRSCARSSQRVREQGYAVAVDELEVGLTAVAAPIRNAHGDVVASMSVSGPTFRLTADRMDDVIGLLIAAADEVSHRLGWGQR